MGNVLSDLWTLVDTVTNLFDLIHDSFVSAVDFVQNGFSVVSGFMSGIPVVGGLAALILALGLVLLVLGR